MPIPGPQWWWRRILWGKGWPHLTVLWVRLEWDGGASYNMCVLLEPSRTRLIPVDMWEIQSSDLLGKILTDCPEKIPGERKGRGQQTISGYLLLYNAVVSGNSIWYLSLPHATPNPCQVCVGRDNGGRKWTQFPIRREHNSFVGTLGNPSFFRSFLCPVTIIAKTICQLFSTKWYDKGCYENTRIQFSIWKLFTITNSWWVFTF